MSLTELLQDAEIQPVDSEADFFERWQQCASHGCSPFSLAVQSGLQADQFAWIFAAGYQSAVRHVFSERFANAQNPAQWYAFAVSEDRSPDNPLPGVDWREEQGDYIVSGFKTWVAGSKHASQIIIKAGRGERARYLCVPVVAEGLTLSHKDSPSVLPDLSQGVAEFDHCRVSRDLLLESGAAKSFAATEVLYIYTAFLASAWLRVSAQRPVIEAFLQKAAVIADQPVISREGAMHELDADVQELLKNLGEAVYQSDPVWQRDRKLIEMYSRQ